MRQEFVLKALAKEESISELCRQFGVSRKTGYKWLERFEEQGLTGLVDESRRPNTFPTQIAATTAEAVIALRREHIHWGPKKIHAVLKREAKGQRVPSLGSIARILNAAGLARAKKQRPISGGPAPRPPRLDPREPNDVWTVDFKGWWRAKDGARVEPLTVRDALSRFMLAVRILPSTKTEDVRPVFEELFARYGLPKTIQSDNGSPFASTRGLAGLTALSAWWISLGIHVVRSRPGCPQDNGGHERMHADMRIEIQDVAAANVVEQQLACDEWVTVFNLVRPHEALDMRTPGELYRPSARRLSHATLGGFPDGCEFFKVHRNHIRWRRYKIHIGAAFNGHSVGVQRWDERKVRIWFFHLLLGTCTPGEPYSFEPFFPEADTSHGVVRDDSEDAIPISRAIGFNAEAETGGVTLSA